MGQDKDKTKKMDTDFNLFWDNYHVDETTFPHRRAATFREWNKRLPHTRKAMLDKVTKEGGPHKKNPFFYVQEFPDPEPDFLSGQQQDALRAQGIPLVQVKYGDKFLICTKQTQQDFHLTLIRDW